jgi:DNA repair exonuclease SbcCD nuclease subunit
MSVRFLHLADLHLGSQLKTQHQQSRESKEILDSAVYTAVERLFDVAIEEAVDFVIVAGDLYDADARSVKANSVLKEQFERLADQDIPAYVTYGNHDPVGSATTYVDLPDNVHEFDHEEPEEFLYPDPESPEARIWGQSYRDRHESRSMYRRFTPSDERLPNIGVLHTGLNPDGRRYVPVGRGKLEKKDDIHYWALGHIHKSRVFTNEQPISYPGIPQGRQITEPGLGGGYLVELDSDGAADIEFVPTSPVVWQTVDVDVSSEDVESIPDLQRVVERAADDLSAPTDLFENLDVAVRDPAWGVDGYICRWRLTGNGPAHETLSRDEEAIHELTRRLRQQLMSRKTFIWTEAVRETTGPPVPSLDELDGEDPVIDEFLGLVDEFEGDELKDVLGGTIGKAWEPVEDHEETQPDRLPLTDERLGDLVDQAEQRVIEELAIRRGE